jgi:hypothetical protein
VDVAARPVSQGEFWKGMMIPLAAVAVFVIATGAYGIYVRSVVQRAPARAVAKGRQVPNPTPVSPARPNVPRSTPPRTSPPQMPQPVPTYRPPAGLQSSPDVSRLDGSKLPKWVGEDVTGLGPAVSVGEYSIRPPALWTASGSSGGSSRMWMGQRAGGGNVSISPRMNVAISPRTDRTRRVLPAVVTRGGEQIPSGSGRVIYAPGGSVEYGMVNGIAVAKVTLGETGFRRRVQYGAFHGENYIFVDGWYDARDGEAPRLIEGAVRTLMPN